MKGFIKAFFLFMFILCAVGMGSLVCFAENTEVEFSNNVTVMEFYAKRGENVENIQKDLSLISLECDSKTIEFLYVSTDTYELKFKNSSNEMVDLCDINGNKLLLKENVDTHIVIIYDDVAETIRYNVNGITPFFVCDDKLIRAVSVPIYATPEQGNGIEQLKHNEMVSELNIYNVKNVGIPEILAFQTNNFDNSIRILSGIDMIWYDNIGFELKLYTDDVASDIQNVSTNIIYESLVADDKKVTADEYGYNYFGTLVIKEINIDSDKSYYILARPYITIDNNKYYGSMVKIDITQNGYSFDSKFKSTLLFDNQEALSLSEEKDFCKNGLLFETYGATLELSADFLGGEVYVDILMLNSTSEKCDFELYVDNSFVKSFSLNNGRNSVFLTKIAKGTHAIKIVKKNNTSALVFGFTYLQAEHIHTVSNLKTPLLNNDTIKFWCNECQDYFSLKETSNPIFMLTFESDVESEAKQYSGFDIVNSQNFKIETDTDGDKALHAETNSLYVDFKADSLPDFNYYSISFDITITKKGNSGFETSLLTLITNYKNGKKEDSNKTADFEYFLKYNVDKQKFATVKISGDTTKLNAENSVDMTVGTQYKIVIVIDNLRHKAHVFVNDTYIGISEKDIVDFSQENGGLSFKFNDGGACYPVYDNFKIVALK